MEPRKSVSGSGVTLNSVPVTMRSVGRKIMDLSVTEERLIAETMEVHEIIYTVMML